MSAGKMFDTRHDVPCSHDVFSSHTRNSSCVHEALQENPVAEVCVVFTLSQHTWPDWQVAAPHVIWSDPCWH
jgi:hypothetical protein